MKTKLTLILLFSIGLLSTASAQTAMYGKDFVSCSGKQFFVIENESKIYAVEVKGNISKTAGNDTIVINGYKIKPEVTAVAEKKFSDNPEMNALINYNTTLVASNNQPGTQVESQFKKTPQGKTILLLSSNIDGKPISASIVFENRILTLSIVTGPGDKDEALKLLEQIINTAITIDKKEDLCRK